VQFGAFASAALAKDDWRRIQGLMVGRVEGRQLDLDLEPVTVKGETLYRAVIRGFHGAADASGFCRALGTKGLNCFVRQ